MFRLQLYRVIVLMSSVASMHFVQTVITEAQEKKEQDGSKRTLNNRKEGGWMCGGWVGGGG